MTRLFFMLIALGLAAPALAHEGATGIVKERMDAMKALGALTKSMAEKIKGNRNLASLADDAQEIANVAAKIPGWFPPGSTQPPTEAASDIWTDIAGFELKAAAMKSEAEALAALAPAGDPAPIAAQFRTLASTCKSCHDRFRSVVPK
jgi:cytochrome c556